MAELSCCDRQYGPQILRYLLSDPLQKRFVTPVCRIPLYKYVAAIVSIGVRHLHGLHLWAVVKKAATDMFVYHLVDGSAHSKNAVAGSQGRHIFSFSK